MATFLLNDSTDGDSAPSLGILFRYSTILCLKKFFLMSSLNFLWHNITSSSPVTSYPRKKINVFLSATSCQVVVETDEVSSHFPQLLLTTLIFMYLHQPHCSSLYTLGQLNILGAAGPKVIRVAEVWPHQCHTKGSITSLIPLATLFLMQAKRCHFPYLSLEFKCAVLKQVA